VTGSMLADQLLDLKRSDALLVLAYGRLYKEVAAVFGEAKALGLQSVLVTEATGTPLAKLADVVVAIPRGRPGHVALHGATLVGLEALVLSLAAARPDASMSSLDNLNHLRAVIEGRRNVRS
jgi:DNA-binding MurR/RpiR family transcriptional regulator